MSTKTMTPKQAHSLAIANMKRARAHARATLHDLGLRNTPCPSMDMLQRGGDAFNQALRTLATLKDIAEQECKFDCRPENYWNFTRREPESFRGAAVIMALKDELKAAIATGLIKP